jgi:ACS family allantoate permease-like MFS transporter
VLTATAGIAFLFVMPDNQLNARFLTEEERVLAVHRIKVNEQGIGNKHFKWYQMKEALTDPMVWAFVFYALVADIPNGGLTNFFSQLIVSFGYTEEQSLLYGTPGGAVEVISLLLCGYLGDRYGNRLLICTSGLLFALLGVILVVAIPLDMPAGRLVGYYFTQVSGGAVGDSEPPLTTPGEPYAVCGALVPDLYKRCRQVGQTGAVPSTNWPPGWTKKTTVAAMYLIAYCTGNIIGTTTLIFSNRLRGPSSLGGAGQVRRICVSCSAAMPIPTAPVKSSC